MFIAVWRRVDRQVESLVKRNKKKMRYYQRNIGPTLTITCYVQYFFYFDIGS